jgi:peptidoglycan/xylan/chitin deacetylase (PgdA/CDA1 family)/SAM-dependent methyltransferase
VIPAKNAGKTLARTLDSLLAQSDADWQALVIDDGSSDDTPQLIAGHAGRDKRFIALRNEGSPGASAARNLGLRQARGQRVVFLDSDDWIDPTFLERMHAALDGAPRAAAAYCDYQRVMPDGALAPVHSAPDMAGAPFATFARTCAVAIHAVLIEREVAMRAGGFDTSLRTCEDWDLWQRVARLGGAWVHVAETLAFYRVSDNSLSQDVERVMADAAVVIRRGYGSDPRVSSVADIGAVDALPADGIGPDIALAYFALWCCAFDAGRGDAHRGLRDELQALPADSEHTNAVVATLLDGLMVGMRAVPRQLAARWGDYGARITALIDALGAMWGDPLAARRVQYAFERLLLQYDDLAAPRVLSLTLGRRIELRELPSVTPPAGVDRLYIYLCDGATVIAVIEPGTLGTLGPRQWLELAAHRLGWKAVMRLAGLRVARSATPGRLAAAARSARAQLRRSAVRDQGWRRVVKAAAREALLAAAPPASSGNSHAGHLERLREQALAQAAASLPSRPPSAAAEGASTRETGALQEYGAEQRRAFWEHFFRQPDPWNYGSAYEQEKYGFQLALLPDGPIETALELACAEGHFTDQLARRVQRLTASDISATALARAAERCSRHANIDFRQLDLTADALPQGLDLIVCSEVLYFLEEVEALRRVAQRMADALKSGGHIVLAHALVLKDDMACTGFDWDNPWGARTISRVFAEVPTLALERSLRTELYRVDRFVRRQPTADLAEPLVETRPIEAEIEHEVARYIVWGGASARRTELAGTERHQRIPVLAYHRVADAGPAALARWRVGVDAFAAQMSWLRRQGYHSIGSAELAWFLERRHPFVGRPVMITFDDGYQDFADAAWPILRRHDLRAEVFIVTDAVGSAAEWDRHLGEPAELMDAATLTRLAAEGVSFGSHLASHRDARGLTTHELAEELTRSRAMLAHWQARPVASFAAPYGQIDARLCMLAKECGFCVGFSTEFGAAALTSDPLKLPRFEVRSNMTQEEFITMMEACR